MHLKYRFDYMDYNSVPTGSVFLQNLLDQGSLVFVTRNHEELVGEKEMIRVKKRSLLTLLHVCIDTTFWWSFFLVLSSLFNSITHRGSQQ